MFKRTRSFALKNSAQDDNLGSCDFLYLESKLLHRFVSLNNEIFSCFLEADYPTNEYFYERRLHVQKNKCMKILCSLRLGKKENYYRLYSLILDYSQLRHRVGDHTVFGVCRIELIAIKQAINKILLQITFSQTNTLVLQEKIDRFEDIYHNIINITARDPAAFVLFISSLKIFSKEIELFTI